jgi:AcrR family transcriptional regulator
LAARRQQILDAARLCFLRNGFHQSSMQDVVKEANLSIGAVYRYFPSKNAIITELAGEVIDQIAVVFDEIVRADPPLALTEIMHRATDFVTANTGPDGMLRLALQVWAEAQRDTELGTFVESVYQRIRDKMIAVADLAQRRGELPTNADPVAIGTVLFAMMPGYALQRILIGVEPDVFKAGLWAVLGAVE